jgi:hypothetical protein
MVGMLGVIAIFSEQGSAQNLLVNPGFEDPITSDGPPFIGSWEGFQGANASAANSMISPRTGAQHVSIATTGDQTFAGVFQDVAVIAGQETVFSGFYRAETAPLGPVSEIRIEWRNAGSNTEISRTLNLTTPPTGVYTEFSLAATVPAGADLARVVYAIQTFTNEGQPDTGAVFLDDMSFVVPEPSSALALGAGGLVMALRRRRSA